MIARALVLTLAFMAGCYGPIGTPSDSFDSPAYGCALNPDAPAPVVDSLALMHVDGTPLVVGDRMPFETFTDGEPLSDFALRVTGQIDKCVRVDARVASSHKRGGLRPDVQHSGLLRIRMGPVGPKYDLDIFVGDKSVHADVVDYNLTAVR